jgi:hypothetical protein
MQGVKDTEGGRVRIWVLENGDKGFLGFGREVRDVVIRVLQAPIFWGWERFCWVQVIEGGKNGMLQAHHKTAKILRIRLVTRSTVFLKKLKFFFIKI